MEKEKKLARMRDLIRRVENFYMRETDSESRNIANSLDVVEHSKERIASLMTRINSVCIPRMRNDFVDIFKNKKQGSFSWNFYDNLISFNLERPSVESKKIIFTMGAFYIGEFLRIEADYDNLFLTEIKKLLKAKSVIECMYYLVVNDVYYSNDIDEFDDFGESCKEVRKCLFSRLSFVGDILFFLKP